MAEVHNAITGDFLTENPEHGYNSALGPGKIVKSLYKGLTPKMKRAVYEEQAKQKEELKVNTISRVLSDTFFPTYTRTNVSKTFVDGAVQSFLNTAVRSVTWILYLLRNVVLKIAEIQMTMDILSICHRESKTILIRSSTRKSVPSEAKAERNVMSREDARTLCKISS